MRRKTLLSSVLRLSIANLALIRDQTNAVLSDSMNFPIDLGKWNDREAPRAVPFLTHENSLQW